MRRRGKKLWLPPVVSLALHGIVLAAAMSFLAGGGPREGASEADIRFDMLRHVEAPAPPPVKVLPATFRPMPKPPPLTPPEFPPLEPLLRDPPRNVVVAENNTAAAVLLPPKPEPEQPPKPAPTKPKPVQDAPPKPAPAARAAQPGPTKADAPPAGGASGYLSLRTVNYIRRGKAAYPAEALRRKQTGTVRLLLYINERGTVDRTEIVQSSGFPLLDAAAQAAERRSVFKPAVINGAAVKTKVIVPYTFNLR